MRKPERVKLRNKLLIYLNSIADGALKSDRIDCIECECVGALSRVSISAYLPSDAKDTLWIACRLIDWPEDHKYPQHWRGFDHWKQNFHPGKIERSDLMMEYVRQHFSRFHITEKA